MRLIVLAAAVMLAGGCEKPKPAEATGPGDPVVGKVIYTRVCKACHQADGTGMNGVLAADFTTGDRLLKPDAVLLNSIAEGKKGANASMPAQKNVLTAQEMKDALAYIRQRFTPKRSAQ